MPSFQQRCSLQRFPSALAQSAASDNLSGPLSAAQSLGARTRAEITRLGIHNADTNRALALQRDGDQALRDRDPVKAEDYGRAEEAVSMRDRERVSAREARSKTDAALQRAKSAGADVAAAERLGASGDQALATGNYHGRG